MGIIKMQWINTLYMLVFLPRLDCQCFPANHPSLYNSY